jgi:hypothetical protein
VQYIVAVVFLLIAFVLYLLLPDELSSLSALFDLNSKQNLGIRLSIVVAGLLAAYNLVKAPINNDRVWRHYRLEKFGTNRRVQAAIEGANNWALQCPRPECGKTTHLIQYDCHQALYRCDGCGEEIAVRRKNFSAKQPPQRQRRWCYRLEERSGYAERRHERGRGGYDIRAASSAEAWQP